MTIQPLEISQIKSATALVWNVFLEFEAPDYSSQGIKTFRNFLEDAHALSQLTFFGAYEGGALAGVIALRNNRHISLFFVEKAFQHKGIGKALFQQAIGQCQGKHMTVNSSPYAVAIYAKLGFTATGPEQLQDGIRFTPMVFDMPVIQSQRLYLRKITAADYDHLSPMLQDAEVMHAWGHGFSPEEVRAWMNRRLESYAQNGYSYFLAIHKESGNVVGQIGLLNEDVNGQPFLGIGYILNKAYWHQGYATEGAKACLDYAFQTLKATQVICDIRPENKASIAVAKRLGMALTDQHLKHYKGKDLPHLVYTIYCGDSR